MRLTVGGQPYRFVGINMWQAVWVAAEEPERLKRELDLLQANGVDALRVTAASEGAPDAPLQVQPTLQPRPGVFDERLGVALDLLLHELRRRRMRAILVLNNQWTWSGGFATYLIWARGQSWRDIPYPSKHLSGYWEGRDHGHGGRPKRDAATWHDYQTWASGFYDEPKAVEYAERTIHWLVGRTNTYSGVRYSEDASILAWQLCNEPRAVVADGSRAPAAQNSYLGWVAKTSALIKTLAPQQLVTVGSEGTTPFADYVNYNMWKTHAIPSVSFVTAHAWPQNWGWGDAGSAPSFDAALKRSIAYIEENARVARKLNKPLLLEEFGLARDMQGTTSAVSVTRRDTFYSAVLAKAASAGLKDDVAIVKCEGWCYDKSHCAYCKCRGCAHLRCENS